MIMISEAKDEIDIDLRSDRTSEENRSVTHRKTTSLVCRPNYTSLDLDQVLNERLSAIQAKEGKIDIEPGYTSHLSR
jgi:hypothetical protein